jgi:gamma-glutamyltranspeptidase/glutathione hydrolase
VSAAVDLPRPLLRGARGSVACGHPLGVTAGLQALAAGGGAVDAAVAAAAALAVVLPQSCGFGGDALLLVHAPGGAVTAFNGSGAAPGGLAGPIPRDGAGAAAVPGAVAAWADAHELLGRLAFAETLRPALELARDGFPVDEGLAAAVTRQRPRLERGAPGWPLLRARAGETVRQPPLAVLIEALARDGARAFYEGPTAQAVAARCAADGGTLSAADLAAHRTVVRDALRVRFGPATVTLQPPVSQAALAGLALRTLEAAAPSEAAGRTHVAIEAVEAAFEHRDELAVEGAAERLLSAPPAEIDRERARRLGGPRGYAHTTAVTTADASGTVVSMLISVFDDFGCASLVPEGGFLLNDRLAGCSSDPASPNAAAPGRRPVHTLAPALLEHGGRLLALATPGADGQVQTLLQVVDALVTEGASLPDVLRRPRWRSQEARVLVEESVPDALAGALSVRGHDLERLPDGDGLFGAVAVAGVESGQGTVLAAADPRRETWAGVW